MSYEKGSLNAPHVSAAEHVLRTWDERRKATDHTQRTVAPQNIGQFVHRLGALFRALYDMERARLDVRTARVLDMGFLHRVRASAVPDGRVQR